MPRKALSPAFGFAFSPLWRPPLLLFASLAAMLAANAASAAEAPEPQTRYLWPDGAPQAQGEGDADKPLLFVYLPAADKATGAGVIVCPGGGYGGHAMDHEGVQIARFYNSIGVAAFVLRYRLSPYRHPVPLMDAQRAIRLVRHDAKKYGVDPRRIGIMGFSAGGHLASTAGTHFDSGDANAKDSIDRESCRPDFLVLCYPVISFTESFQHGGSRRNLLGDKADDAKLTHYLSSEKQVTKDTPPTFLFHTNEDTGVPPENSVLLYLALRKAGVPAEMHIYAKGPHGVGLMPGDPVLSSWSKRLADWLSISGFLSAGERVPVRGRVSLDGKPLSYGTIAFIPEKGAGPARSTVVARVRNGEFQFDSTSGPEAGKHRVLVTCMSHKVISMTPTLPEEMRLEFPAVIEAGEGERDLNFELKSKAN